MMFYFTGSSSYLKRPHTMPTEIPDKLLFAHTLTNPSGEAATRIGLSLPDRCQSYWSTSKLYHRASFVILQAP